MTAYEEFGGGKGGVVKHRLLALACAVATVLPAAAWAQDLLTVWQAAAQHDRQAVARAERAATRPCASRPTRCGAPVCRCRVGGPGRAGHGHARRAFSAPGMGQIDEARFATSVDGGLATRLGVTVQRR